MTVAEAPQRALKLTCARRDYGQSGISPFCLPPLLLIPYAKGEIMANRRRRIEIEITTPITDDFLERLEKAIQAVLELNIVTDCIRVYSFIIP